ncbi:phosphoribosylanthranilate isomerase [Sporolactobacillus sp. THM7-4]|nr:phosphoribosylanthranilate isomerase [Sporolactobacillus sp. THM7-4]
MRPILKYCGNHSLSDVTVSMAGKADYIGFIFTKKSRRTVTAVQVRDWLDQVQCSGRKKLVGVFADDPVERIESVLNTVPLQVIQLHGHESPRELRLIRSRTRTTVWKALHHGVNTLEKMRAYSGSTDGYVIDTKVKGQLGGTGVTFDWESVPEYMQEASRQRVPCLIAGGVTPANIARLLAYRPDGIDIASGIEDGFQKSSLLIRKIEEKVWDFNDQRAERNGEKYR